MNLRRKIKLLAESYKLSESQQIILEKCLSTKENLMHSLDGFFKQKLSTYTCFYFAKRVKEGETSQEILKEIRQEMLKYVSDWEEFEAKYNLISSGLRIGN